MKPKRIILIRHGESQTVVPDIHHVKPDYAYDLTMLGQSQAEGAGDELKSIIGDQSVFFYRSSFYRARQTRDHC